MKTFTRREYNLVTKCLDYYETFMTEDDKKLSQIIQDKLYYCLLYTSDAADES